MLLFLATELQTNAFDTEFLGKLIQALIALSLGYGAAQFGKRKPSMEVDFAGLQQRVDALEGDMKAIDRKLDAGASIHRELQAGQSANTARIEGIRQTCHDLSTRLGQMPQQIATLTQKK